MGGCGGVTGMPIVIVSASLHQCSALGGGASTMERNGRETREGKERRKRGRRGRCGISWDSHGGLLLGIREIGWLLDPSHGREGKSAARDG
ncbi:hypothetical protein B0I35DRAFT_433351 [Stachybotrys elegans]|uniref:Uncharacterized protein n=1 Tax=Stachybotrys elegans TaxID=80388 RepID=A0A8K0SM23_9HYPO|nr:hypothetical protein B0I35DRAFT_433351 [Stachybotrys elegans]